MASNRFDAHQMVSSMELSVTDAIYALSDIIEAYQSPSHVALLESFRKEHGGNMIKRMQIIYPAAIKLQAQVRTLATLCKISFAKDVILNVKLTKICVFFCKGNIKIWIFPRWRGCSSVYSNSQNIRKTGS